uniref:Putative integrase n=1 Tax=Prochloron didemni P1-Palau TaxID=910450 RepID=G0XS56_PRODI|nr:putative integrase [Prochloron didemni P1-Palau]
MYLSFNLETQIQSHLCWAAVACSIAKFYDSNSIWTQESLVDHLLGEFKNRYFYAERALEVVKVFKSKLSRPLTFEEIKVEIQQSRIIAIRVSWAFGGGHLVALYGYTDDREVYIADPKYNVDKLDYHCLKEKYLTFGSWTHTYFTQPLV